MKTINLQSRAIHCPRATIQLALHLRVVVIGVAERVDGLGKCTARVSYDYNLGEPVLMRPE